MTTGLTPLRKMGKKGQMGLSQLPSVAVVFVLLIVTVAIGAYVTNQVGDQLPAGSTAANVTSNGESAFDVFSSWFSILVVIVVAAVVIGLISLYQRFQ